MEATGRKAEIMIAEARKAFWVMVGFLALIWSVQVVNWALGYGLSREFGLEAWNPASLPDILSSPFLHWSWDHIEANSGPLFIFGFLSAYRGVARFLSVTGLIIVVSGVGAWLTSQPGSVGAGHLFGFAAGVLGGWVFRDRVRPKPAAPAQSPRSALLKELDDLGL